MENDRWKKWNISSRENRINSGYSRESLSSPWSHKKYPLLTEWILPLFLKLYDVGWGGSIAEPESLLASLLAFFSSFRVESCEWTGSLLSYSFSLFLSPPSHLFVFLCPLLSYLRISRHRFLSMRGSQWWSLWVYYDPPERAVRSQDEYPWGPVRHHCEFSLFLWFHLSDLYQWQFQYLCRCLLMQRGRRERGWLWPLREEVFSWEKNYDIRCFTRWRQGDSIVEMRYFKSFTEFSLRLFSLFMSYYKFYIFKIISKIIYNKISIGFLSSMCLQKRNIGQ